ncbi:Transposase [Marinomonas sp. MED121]|uniref:IS1182 family transposase n=1 Tax=Marinomonas sp. MED121 TaxID=314277 RepID=UPI000069122E|nr:IS1182 family transposase [Marinomonas sp. MED121]EAQ67746.1 Transposase [Marinomonas sp. MED121]
MNKNYRKTENRAQFSLFIDHLDQHISDVNPVRAIDAYIDTLNFDQLAVDVYKPSSSLRGQPAYNPADLLRLYLYGYLNGIRSSRKLEKECRRNIELMWLIKHQRPSYKTIANFRKDHHKLLIQVNRDFVLLCKQLDLVGGELIAIDGSFFHGNASKQSILTKNRLTQQLKAIEQKVQDYHAMLDALDNEESEEGSLDNIKLDELTTKQANLNQMLKELAQSGNGQLSRTDPDARLLFKRGAKIAGYNIQAAVDDRHHLIIASDVTNDGNDQKQLYPMSKRSKETLGVDKLTVLADAGYYETANLHFCTESQITPYVPIPNKSASIKKQNRFTRDHFQYNATNNHYICPEGKSLIPSSSLTIKHNKKQQLYISHSKDCKNCFKKDQCLAKDTTRRKLYRNEYEFAIDEHKRRMERQGEGKMKLRGAIVEHPFGTLKMKAGWQHFLVRGFKKVRGEWSLMNLAYNFTRVLNILGIKGFKAYCQ